MHPIAHGADERFTDPIDGQPFPGSLIGRHARRHELLSRHALDQQSWHDGLAVGSSYAPIGLHRMERRDDSSRREKHIQFREQPLDIDRLAKDAVGQPLIVEIVPGDIGDLNAVTFHSRHATEGEPPRSAVPAA